MKLYCNSFVFCFKQLLGTMAKMKVIIRCSIFSGTEDPEWVLTKEEEIIEIEKIYNKKTKLIELYETMPKSLGYTGFEVITECQSGVDLPSRLWVYNGAISSDISIRPMQLDTDNELEEHLLKTAEGKPNITDKIFDYMTEQVGLSSDKYWKIKSILKTSILNSKKLAGRVEPNYAPRDWNQWHVRMKNNCFNYAIDVKRYRFAHPGEFSETPHNKTKDTIVDACNEDGLEFISDDITYEKKLDRPKKGHYVALFLHEYVDYHWYRLDKKGEIYKEQIWSHKPGTSFVRTYDEGTITSITSLSEANTGNYNIFCGFFLSIKEKLKNYPNIGMMKEADVPK